jgi:hypothetical protein
MSIGMQKFRKWDKYSYLCETSDADNTKKQTVHEIFNLKQLKG